MINYHSLNTAGLLPNSKLLYVEKSKPNFYKKSLRTSFSGVRCLMNESSDFIIVRVIL